MKHDNKEIIVDKRDERFTKKFEHHQCPTCKFWHNGKLETYIIHNAEWGIYDHFGYCLRVDFRQEGSGFFLFFSDLKEIQKMLEASKVSKTDGLVGKPAWCYIDDNNSGHFVSMWSL